MCRRGGRERWYWLYLARTRRNNGRKRKEEERGKYKLDKLGKNFY